MHCFQCNQGYLWGRTPSSATPLTWRGQTRALEILRKERVNLIISDINMPRMDGEALLREISADPKLRGIPVVIVSSDATESRASRLLEIGASAYLVKPFQPQMFREKLEQVMEAVNG